MLSLPLPVSEAKNAELLLLEETSAPKRHSVPVSGKKGILSSLLKASSASTLSPSTGALGDVLNPLIRTAYDSISDPVLVLWISNQTLLFANLAAYQLFRGSTPLSQTLKDPAQVLEGLQVQALLPHFSMEKIQPLMDQSKLGAPSKELSLMAKGPHHHQQVPVSLACGRLAQEGLLPTAKKISAEEVLVLTLKRAAPSPLLSGLAVSRYRSEFEEIKTMGRGGFGIVVQARNRLDGQDYAIKKVRLSCSPENLNIFTNSTTPTSKEMTGKFFRKHSRHMSESDHRLLNEVKTFALLSNHPNVIRYYNAWIEPADSDRSLDDLDSSDSEDDDDFIEHDRSPRHQTTLFIQMQLCPYQDLRKWISSRDVIKLDQSLSIFWQIVSGLVHIHAQGVIHRDVKPENIFVHNDHVFLGDFGLAKNIQDHAIELSPQQSLVETFVTSTEDGTFLYMAPEILTSQVCTTKSDVYSLGVILFELLTHFDTVMERVVTLNQLKETGVIPNHVRELFPAQCLLLDQLLDKDPQNRPTTQEILSNEVFYDVSSRRGTASSFGGSGTNSPMSIDFELLHRDSGSRRRSGGDHFARDPHSRLPLRCSKSAVSLEFDNRGQTLPRRSRRPTEELTWMPWGHEDLETGETDQFPSPPPLWGELPTSTQNTVPIEIHHPHTEDCAHPLPSLQDPSFAPSTHLTHISSSYIEPDSVLGRRKTETHAHQEPRDRIKTLERDVALLEAKLQAMTAHSARLENELVACQVLSASPSSSSLMGGIPAVNFVANTSAGDSFTLPIPIPSSRN